MQRIFSVWENKSKNGDTYFTGRLGDLGVIGFINKDKTNDKQPDIQFYVREEKKEETKEEKKETKKAAEDIFADFGDLVEDNFLD